MSKNYQAEKAQKIAKLQRLWDIYNNIRSGTLLAWVVALPTMTATTLETGLIIYFIAVPIIALIKKNFVYSFRKLGWVK